MYNGSDAASAYVNIKEIHTAIEKTVQYQPPANEDWLAACCTDIRNNICRSRPEHWLLLARLTETAILTAGQYADNAEYTAAGDLLVNPRKIAVFLKNAALPVTKARHGRISDQFRPDTQSRHAFIHWFSRNGMVMQEEPPLLPHLMNILEESGCLARAYLDDCRNRLQKIADTMGFLNSWGICCFEDLAARKAAMIDTETIIAEHLCCFGTDWFDIIGEEIQYCRTGMPFKSRVLHPQKRLESGSVSTTSH